MYIENQHYVIIDRFILRSDIITGEQILPLYDLEAFGGINAQFVDNDKAIDEVKIDGIPPCDGAINITGESMSPVLMPGDIVLYKTVPNRRGGLFFGNIYLLVFDLEGEEYISVKHVYQSEKQGYYRLESENPNYEPTEIPIDCVRKMAIVKACIRKI